MGLVQVQAGAAGAVGTVGYGWVRVGIPISG